MDLDIACPCHSGKTYRECCSVYHQGKEPETPQKLMRSRYSAYAMNNIDYIIRTTHPRNPIVSQSRNAWKAEILNIALNTDFEGLEIIDGKENKENAIVVFIARLKRDDEDVTFTERSFFSKMGGRWLYVNGDVFPGEHRELKAEF